MKLNDYILYGVGHYRVDGQGLWVYKKDGEWYLGAIKDSSNGVLREYDTNGTQVRTYKVHAH
ncbi:hypothetical protein B9C88_07840 [Brevibacillus laterosporus]|nr:hypothetical protein B9C88_07840 [Brevibacillus laterosporus]